MIPTAFNIAGAVLINNSIGLGSVALLKHYYKWCLRGGVLVVVI